MNTYTPRRGDRVLRRRFDVDRGRVVHALCLEEQIDREATR